MPTFGHNNFSATKIFILQQRKIIFFFKLNSFSLCRIFQMACDNSIQIMKTRETFLSLHLIYHVFACSWLCYFHFYPRVISYFAWFRTPLSPASPPLHALGVKQKRENNTINHFLLNYQQKYNNVSFCGNNKSARTNIQ